MQIISDCVGCSRRSYGQPLHRRLIHLQTCSQMEEGRPERNVAAILATDVTGLRERAKLIFAMIAPVVLALNQ